MVTLVLLLVLCGLCCVLALRLDHAQAANRRLRAEHSASICRELAAERLAARLREENATLREDLAAAAKERRDVIAEAARLSECLRLLTCAGNELSTAALGAALWVGDRSPETVGQLRKLSADWETAREKSRV